MVTRVDLLQVSVAPTESRLFVDFSHGRWLNVRVHNVSVVEGVVAAGGLARITHPCLLHRVSLAYLVPFSLRPSRRADAFDRLLS